MIIIHHFNQDIFQSNVETLIFMSLMSKQKYWFFMDNRNLFVILNHIFISQYNGNKTHINFCTFHKSRRHFGLKLYDTNTYWLLYYPRTYPSLTSTDIFFPILSFYYIKYDIFLWEKKRVVFSFHCIKKIYYFLRLWDKCLNKSLSFSSIKLKPKIILL